MFVSRRLQCPAPIVIALPCAKLPAWSRAYDEALTHVGFGGNQYAVLATLERSRPQVLQDLARSPVEIAFGTLDGRRRIVAPTEAGCTLVTTARPIWAEAQNRFERAFGDEAADALRIVLARVVAIQTLPPSSDGLQPLPAQSRATAPAHQESQP